MPRGHRGDGIHRRVLGYRCFRSWKRVVLKSIWSMLNTCITFPAASPTSSIASGASVSAFGRPVEGLVSSRTGRLRGSFSDAASRKPRSNGLCSCAAYAQAARSNEPPDSPRHQRYHRSHRTGYRGCHCDRANQPRRVSQIAGLPDQSFPHRHRYQKPRRRLSSRTHLHAQAIADPPTVTTNNS